MDILLVILRYVFAIAGMAAVAWIVWKVVNRQEAKDAAFQKKLDDDDARAAKGRFGPPPKI
jgi:flagellar basal body-associated protein FliL